jgi:hypothetical protein
MVCISQNVVTHNQITCVCIVIVENFHCCKTCKSSKAKAPEELRFTAFPNLSNVSDGKISREIRKPKSSV